MSAAAAYRVVVNVTPPRWVEKAGTTAAEKVVEAVWSVWPGTEVRIGAAKVTAVLVVDETLTYSDYLFQRRMVRDRVRAAVAPLRCVNDVEGVLLVVSDNAGAAGES